MHLKTKRCRECTPSLPNNSFLPSLGNSPLHASRKPVPCCCCTLRLALGSLSCIAVLHPSRSQPAANLPLPLSLPSPHFHSISTISMLVSSPGPHVPIPSPLLDNRGLSKCRSSASLVIETIHISLDTPASPRCHSSGEFRRIKGGQPSNLKQSANTYRK